MNNAHHANPNAVPEDDVRQALYNDQATGSAALIQLPRERITSLHGFFLDLDPGLLGTDNRFFPPADNPRAFHAGIKPVLKRHPLAQHAEIRASGSGLHAIIWLQPAVQLHSAAEQSYWAAIVESVQDSLPADPNAPGITGLTRPVGAFNSKNGGTVEILEAGTPLEPKVVEEFASHLAATPFRQIALVLFGDDRVSPCPVCGDDGTRLGVLDREGMCYGGCGEVTIENLYDRILLPSPAAGKSEKGGAKQPAAAGSTKGKRKSTSQKKATPKRRTSRAK